MKKWRTIRGIHSDIERELNALEENYLVTFEGMSSYQDSLCVVVSLREYKLVTRKEGKNQNGTITDKKNKRKAGTTRKVFK